MSLQLTLAQPLAIKKEMLTELTLRDPVAADFLEVGLPMLVISLDDDKVKGLEFRPKVLCALIARLAGINVDAVKSLAMRDLGRCQAFIFGFLNDDTRGS